MNREQIAAIRAKLQLVLDEFASDNDLDTLKLGNITFSDDGFSTKLTAVKAGGDNKDMTTLKANLMALGLKKSILDECIIYENKSYKLVGLKQVKVVLESNGVNYGMHKESFLVHLRTNYKKHCI